MDKEEKLRLAKQRLKQYQKKSTGTPKARTASRNHSISNGTEDKKRVHNDLNRKKSNLNLPETTNALNNSTSLNNYQKLLFEKTEQFNIINNQLNEKINEIQNLNDLLKTKEVFINSQQETIKKLETDFQENSTKLEELKNYYNEKELEYENKSKSFDELQRKYRELEANNNSQIDFDEKLNQKNIELNKLKELLKEKENIIQENIKELKEISEKIYEKEEIEKINKELQVQIEEHELKIKEYEKQNQDNSDINQEIENKIKDKDSSISQLNEQLIISQSSLEQKEQELNELKQKIFELENEKTNNIKQSEDNKIKYEQELNNLANNIEDEKIQYEQKINSLTIDLENLKLKNNEQVQSYKEINDSIKEKDKEIQQLKSNLNIKLLEIQQINDQYQKLQQLLDEKSNEYDKALSTNQDSQKLLEERIQEYQKISEQYQATQLTINNLTNECQLANNKFNESQSNLNQLTSEYQEINEKYQNLQSLLEQKNKEYEDLNKSLIYNKELFDKKSNEYEELNNKYKDSSVMLNQMTSEIKQLKEDYSKIFNEKELRYNENQKIQELLNLKTQECNNLNEHLIQAEEKMKSIELQKEETLKLIKAKDDQINDLNKIIGNLTEEKEKLNNMYQNIFTQNENNIHTIENLKNDLHEQYKVFQKEKQDLLLKKDSELSEEIGKRDELCNQYELQNEDGKLEIEKLNNEINTLKKQNELLLNQQTQSVAIQNDSNSIPLDLLKKFIPNPTVESALRFLTHLDDVNINLATRETILQEREISLDKKDADINQRELFIMETEKRIEKEKMDLRSVEHKLNTREQVIRDCETDIKLKNMEAERYKMEIDEQIKAEWNNLNIRAKQLTDIDNQQKQLTTKLEADLMTITLERQKMYDQENRVTRLLNQLSAKENELKSLYGDKSLMPSNSTMNLDQEVKNVLSMEQPNILKENETSNTLLNNIKSSEANTNIELEPIPKTSFDTTNKEDEAVNKENQKVDELNSKIASNKDNNETSNTSVVEGESGKEENPSDQQHLLKIIAKLTSTNRSLNNEVRDLHQKVQSFSKSPLYSYSQSPQLSYNNSTLHPSPMASSLRYPTMGSTTGDNLDEIDSQYSYLSQTANLYSKRPSLSQSIKPNEVRSLASTIELSRRNGTRSVQPDMLAPNYVSSRMTRPLLNIGNMASPTLENLIQNSNHSPIIANNNYLYQKSPIQSSLGMVHASPSLSNMPTPSQLQSSRTQLMRRVEDVARVNEERNRAYSISSRMSRQSKPGTELRYPSYSQPGQYY